MIAERKQAKITILHTNDVHSRIEPFARGRYAGQGGAIRRAQVIAQIRKKEEHVLLLDAGDIFQGTPLQTVIFNACVCLFVCFRIAAQLL